MPPVENNGENNGDRHSRGRLRPGNRAGFKRGRSGNPGGRPKGTKTYNMRQLWAEAIEEGETRAQHVQRLKEALTRS